MVFSEVETRAFLRGRVRVVEKLDGLNVGVTLARSGAPRLISRSHGVLRPDQVGPGLWPLVDWVWSRHAALIRLLGQRFVLFGEWLGGPGKLPYPKRRDDFVAFSLFDRRARRFVRGERAFQRAGLTTPFVRFEGRVEGVDALLRLAQRSVLGGPGEGVIVERADGRLAKVVRPEWLALSSGSRAPQFKGAPGAAKAGRLRTKKWPASRRDDFAVESAVLSSLRPVRVGDLELTYREVVGVHWPRRASAALAYRLGQQLGRLHGVKAPRVVPPLPGTPSEHLRRVVKHRELVGLLRGEETHLAAVSPVLCHGDLKPENVIVHAGEVALIDFENAVVADPAWELACAMDRLFLDERSRHALLAGWVSQRGSNDVQLAQRVQLFRIAWRVIGPIAHAAQRARRSEK